MKKALVLILMIAAVNQVSAQNWEVVGNTQATSNEVDQFDIATHEDSIVYVAFADLKMNRRAQTKVLKSGQWTSFGAAAGFSGSTSDLFNLDVLPNGNPILAFRDYNFNYGTRVMLNDLNDANLNWREYGMQHKGINGNYSTNIVMTLNSNGLPYVGLNNKQFNSDFMIMHFDSLLKPYVSISNPSPNSRSLGIYDMAFSPNDELYIVYHDTTLDTNSNFNLNDRISVSKRVGNEWQLVGERGVSWGKTSDVSLEFDSKGNPYVAFYHSYTKDGIFGGGGSVRMFNGTSWVAVGPETITPRSVSGFDMAISPSDTVAISYYGTKNLEVFAFNGNEWQKVGDKASDGAAYRGKIEFGSAGTLYAIFKDGANGNKVTVTKYTGALTTPSQNSSVRNTTLSKVNVFPNPSSSFFTIANLPEGNKTIEVIDVRGVVLSSNTTNAESVQLDNHHLSSGCYWVRITTETTVESLPILIEKQ